MAGDDYSVAIGGGLKLKGSKPSGVTKKKKKDKSKPKDKSTISALNSALADEEQAARKDAEKERGQDTVDERGEDEEEYEPGSSKTDAERKYEEMKRKRVCL